MNTTMQRACAWCGPIAMIGFLIGWGALAGFIPMPSADWSAGRTAEMYQDRQTLIQVGMVVTMLASALITPLVVAVFIHLRRIEGPNAVLAYSQLGLGVLLPVLFIIPCFLIQVAAFRPERDADLVLAFHDAGFLPFVGAFYATLAQVIIVGVCILKDRTQTIFPRWVGWFNLWVAMAMMPDVLMFFFKTGPFGWRGIAPFYIIVVAFCGWFFIMAWAVLRAAKQQEADAAAAEASAAAGTTDAPAPSRDAELERRPALV